MNKKRILITVVDYYPKVSGVPVVTKYLAEGLVEKGYYVMVATGGDDGLPREEIINGVHVYRFNIKGSAYHIPTGECKKYINWALKQKLDIMINVCKPVWTTELLFPILNRIHCIKILHSHGASGLYINRIFRREGDIKHTIGHTYRFLMAKIFYGKLLPNFLDYYDSILCLNKNSREYSYFVKYVDKTKVIELGNAADDMFFSEFIENCIFDYTELHNPRYCISVANYTETKNQIALLKEFYKSKIMDMDLVLVGRNFGGYYKRMCRIRESLEKKYGRRYVHFIQGAKRSDIPGLLKGADVYLCSSLWEAYSISLIEAMACEIPFISTNVGNALFLPGGIVVDEDEIHVALQKVSNNVEIRQKLVRDGRKYACENCRIKCKVNQLDEHIQYLLRHGDRKNE